jgi:pimeloyl-ACP methyl ester carboxylesterase
MKRAYAAFAVTAVLMLGACSTAPAITSSVVTAEATSAKASKPVSGGVVVLLRGGLNIFSTGMDELAKKLRAAGVDARTEPHAKWKELAGEARDRYVKTRKPLVLVGHSWGALAAILLAGELEKTNTPVDLMILYDTTESVKIPSNVIHVVNFNSSTAIGLNLTVTGNLRFHGKIDDIDVPDFDHLNMDNAGPLHDRSIAEILKLIKPNARTASR